MNCENFNEQLPEYLDEALSPPEQIAAREHVQKCDSCQQVLARQQVLTKSLRLSFERDTRALCLSAKTKQTILNAVKEREHRPSAWSNLPTFFAALRRRPVWAGAMLLVLCLLIFVSYSFRHSADRGSSPATRQEARNIYVINVPILSERQVYRSENNMVVDAVVTEDGVINASFSDEASSATSLKPHIN